MKLIIAFTLVLVLISCHDQNDCCGIASANIDISIVSENGTDLLDPENLNSFNENHIRIYHLTDGEFEEVNLPNLDYPMGFFIIDDMPDSVYRIRIFGDVFNESEVVTSLVKWSDSDTDTLKYKVYRSEGGSTVGITKVWFNNIEVWDESSQTERYFEIIK